MSKSKTRAKAWSVAAERILAKIKPGMPADQVAAIEEQAYEQALSDTYGANWRQNLDANGNPQVDGIGSELWLINVEEDRAETHYAAIARFHGPAAERAAREKIARLKANRGK